MSELTERFIDLREDGKTLREIAVITGANYYYVREICRKHKAGIRIQPKKKAWLNDPPKMVHRSTVSEEMYKAKRSNFNSYVVGYLIRNKNDNKIVGILNRANRFHELAWIDEKTITKYCD